MTECASSLPNFPSTLYKYVTVTAAREILSGCKLRFSSPLIFNDPLDSQWNPFWSLYLPDIVESRRSALKRFLLNPKLLPATSPPDYRNVIERLSNSLKDAGSEQIDFEVRNFMNAIDQAIEVGMGAFRSSVLTSLQRLRICSMSQRDDLTTMWSHYADQHKGLALGFATSALQFPTHAQLREVKYSADFPEIIDSQTISDALVCANSEINANIDHIELVVETKSLDWRDEKEWRYVYFANEQTGLWSDVEFNRASLVEVLGGARTSEHELRQIEALARAVNPDVTMVRMKENARGFSLRREEQPRYPSTSLNAPLAAS